MMLSVDSSQFKRQTQAQSEGVEDETPSQGNLISQANGIQKKEHIAILPSDKIDCKPEEVTKDIAGHYIIIKGTMHQEDNIY